MTIPNDDEMVSIELPFGVVKELAQARMVNGEIRSTVGRVAAVRALPDL